MLTFGYPLYIGARRSNAFCGCGGRGWGSGQSTSGVLMRPCAFFLPCWFLRCALARPGPFPTPTNGGQNLAPRASLLAPRSPLLAPRASPRASLLTPRPSLLAPRSSHLAPCSSLLFPRASRLRSSRLAPRASLLSPRSSFLRCTFWRHISWGVLAAIGVERRVGWRVRSPCRQEASADMPPAAIPRRMHRISSELRS